MPGSAAANDPTALQSLRQRLDVARLSSSLFDTQKLAAGLENAFDAMVTRQRLGHPAGHFLV